MPVKRSRYSLTRRRLQKGSFKQAIAEAAVNAVVKHGPRLAGKGAAWIKAKADAKFNDSKAPKRTTYRRTSTQQLLISDNISTLKPTTVGKRRVLTFDEKVSRVERPPILFKRNYQFSVECSSSRKAFFSMELNVNNANDLGADLTSYKANHFTDTLTSDSTASLNGVGDSAKFYVDYLSEKISFMNSANTSLIGKIHLFCQKRDNDNAYGSVPIVPINMMMYYSTQRVLNGAANPNFENTVGNGWKFDTSTSGYNYNAVYNMPGSSINTAGVCALTDLTLSPSSPHIAESIGFWFRKVETIGFNLKPGQQFNKTYIFNDLKDIMREQLDLPHLAGISYSIVVEFQGQMAGDVVVGAGNGVIGTSSGQLSVMRESKRIIGIKNKLKHKILMQTAPPAILTNGSERWINADSSGEVVGVSADI